MKIRNILENIDAFIKDPVDDAEPVSYQKQKLDVTLSDLNSLQMRTLQRIASGAVTVDTASDREFEVMEDLHALGVLDDNYEISDVGHGLLSNASEPESLSKTMNNDVIDDESDDVIVSDDEFEEIDDFSDNDLNLR